VPEPRAHANLRTALWRLGQLARPVVEVHGPDLLIGGTVSVDARQTVAQAHGLLTASTELPVDVATDVFSQVLLPGWYDEWVLVEREQLRQLCLHSLEMLAGALTARGQFGRAVEAAMVAVQDDPLRESAQRALILAYLGEGNRCDAIRVYGEYVAVLDQQLGLEPSPDLQRLVPGRSAA